MKLCKMPNLMGWDLQYIIDQNQDALGIEALPFGAGRIYVVALLWIKKKCRVVLFFSLFSSLLWR